MDIALNFIMEFLNLFRWQGESITQLALNFSIKLSLLFHLSSIWWGQLHRGQIPMWMSRYNLSVHLEHPLGHFISLILGGSKASFKAILHVRELGRLVSEIYPFITTKLTDVRYVSFISKCSSVKICTIQLEWILSGDLINQGMPYHIMIPKNKRGISCSSIFAGGLFAQSDIQLHMIGLLILIFQHTQCCANLVTKIFDLLLLLIRVRAIDQDFRSPNFLEE